jgi:hypothetical protein
MKLYNCYGRLVRPIAEIEKDLNKAKHMTEDHFPQNAQARFYGRRTGQAMVDALVRDFEKELFVAQRILEARKASAVVWDSVLKIKVDNSALIEDVGYSKEE